MSTLHTNLVGARVVLKPEKPKLVGEPPEDYRHGVICAAYLDNTSLPRFLVVLDPPPPKSLQEPPGLEGGELLEVLVSKILSVSLPYARGGYRGGNDRGL